MPHKALENRKKLTKPELNELAAFLYSRYEAHKNCKTDKPGVIMPKDTNRDKANK